MTKKTKITLLIIAAILLELIALGIWGVRRYYKWHGPFEDQSVEISGESTVADTFQYSLAEILKVDDVLFFQDVTDDQRWFRYQDGQLSIVEKYAYWDELSIKNGNGKTGVEFMLESYKNEDQFYQEDENYNLVDQSGAVIVASMERYVINGNWFCAVSAGENEKLLKITTPQESFEIERVNVAEVEEIAADKEKVCIYEGRGPRKSIRIFSLKTKELIAEIEGKYMLMNASLLLYQKDETVYAYDIEQKMTKELSENLRSATSFDENYVYFLTHQGDVGRIKSETMETEMLLISRLEDPVIAFYLDHFKRRTITLK